MLYSRSFSGTAIWRGCRSPHPVGQTTAAGAIKAALFGTQIRRPVLKIRLPVRFPRKSRNSETRCRSSSIGCLLQRRFETVKQAVANLEDVSVLSAKMG